jgi:hypothetical protein
MLAAKRFQESTIRQVTHYLHKPGSRYLVADEVGLGKTIVARGVIQSLYTEIHADNRPFRVIYLCSNADIGKQNIGRLIGDRKLELAATDNQIAHGINSRLTLLALDALSEDKDEPARQLQLVCLTPRTSLQLGNNVGQKRERRLIHALLMPTFGMLKSSGGNFTAKAKKLAAFLVPPAHDNVTEWLTSLERFNRLDLPKLNRLPGLTDDVRTAWEANRKSELSLLPDDVWKQMGRNETLIDCVRHLINIFPSELKHSQRHEILRKCRSYIIGALRTDLALSVLTKFEADLIILDEFQNFSELLIESDKSLVVSRRKRVPEDQADIQARFAMKKSFEARLARKLFDTKARLLLLSATPYRAASSDFDRHEESHYAHFWTIVHFLLHGNSVRVGSSTQIADLKNLFEQYRHALESIHSTDRGLLAKGLSAKAQIEERLSQVMVRTERYRHVDSNFAGVKEQFEAPWEDQLHLPASEISIPIPGTEASVADALYMRWLSSVFPADQRSLLLDIWASLPFALNLMGSHYKIIEQLFGRRGGVNGPILLAAKAEEKAGRSDSYENTRPRFWMRARDLRKFDLVSAAPNPKIRALLLQLRSEDFGKHLWIPPTQPYYDRLSETTERPKKRLIFSAWQAVPQAISILASTDAENRLREELNATGIHLENLAFSFDHPTSITDRSHRSTVILFHPSHWLAEIVDPALDGIRYTDLKTLKDETEQRITRALAEHRIGISSKRRVVTEQSALSDAIWRLEPQWYKDLYREAFTRSRKDLSYPRTLFEGSIPHALKQLELSKNELKQLVQLALGGPGVTILRTVTRLQLFQVKSASDEAAAALRSLLETCHGPVRRFFNTPQAGLAIRSSCKDRPNEAAWRQVLRYCVSRHLQAVLDEFAFLSSKELLNQPGVKRLREFLQQIELCFQIPAGQPAVRELSYRSDRGAVRMERVSRHIAQAFTDEKIQAADGSSTDVLRDHIRKAFNTPFWPFVLATTSIGQEGLDFHRYCMDVVHWNLPSNPVAFEQREGRVQRYLGQSIRDALCRDLAWATVLANAKSLKYENPWDMLLKLAEDKQRRSLKGLSPYWIYQKGDNVARIRRWILCHPFSKEALLYRRMRESILLYRLTLGQARQEDLISAIDRNLRIRGSDERGRQEIVRKLWIDLGPRH